MFYHSNRIPTTPYIKKSQGAEWHRLWIYWLGQSCKPFLERGILASSRVSWGMKLVFATPIMASSYLCPQLCSLKWLHSLVFCFFFNKFWKKFQKCGCLQLFFLSSCPPALPSFWILIIHVVWLYPCYTLGCSTRQDRTPPPGASSIEDKQMRGPLVIIEFAVCRALDGPFFISGNRS